MTTYHTARETDGVPAPSDHEFPTQVAHGEQVFTFNAWNTATGITLDRERWHAYVRRYVGIGNTMTDDQWWWFYRAFLHDDDAADQYATQADALV